MNVIICSRSLKDLFGRPKQDVKDIQLLLFDAGILIGRLFGQRIVAQYTATFAPSRDGTGALVYALDFADPKDAMLFKLSWDGV